MDAVTSGGGPVHNLGPLERIPAGEGRLFVVGGRELAVFRSRDGRVFATEAACPHRQGPLADGLVGGATVVCPLHGFRFDLETGSPRGHECRAVATYGATLTEGGDILVTLEDG